MYLFPSFLTYSMEQSTSWEANRFSASQEITRILCTYLLTFVFIYFFPSLLTYLLTPWSRVVLEKLTGSHPVKKLPAFYGTRMFITAFTNARYLSLSWARSIQSIPPYPTAWRSTLILSSHLWLGLPSGLFPSGFPTKTLYTILLSPIHATCPAHLILLDFITQTVFGEQYRSLSSSLCSFLYSPVTLSQDEQVFLKMCPHYGILYCRHSFFLSSQWLMRNQQFHCFHSKFVTRKTTWNEQMLSMFVARQNSMSVTTALLM